MAKKSLLPSYFASLPNDESKKNYLLKLSFITGRDPYEIPRDFKNDVGLRPCVTYIHVKKSLLFKQSIYTQDSLTSYKSLKWYETFANLWVMEMLCKDFGNKLLLIER